MKKSLKKIPKYFVRFIILLLLAYIWFSLYLQYFAKEHVKGFISRSLKKEVEFSRIVYRFPLEFQVYDVVIDKFLVMEGMSVRFSKNFLVEKDIHIAKMLFVKPQLDLNAFPLNSDVLEPLTLSDVSSPEEIVVSPAIPEKESVDVQGLSLGQTPSVKEGTQYNIKVSNLIISNGHLSYPYTFSGKEVLLNVEGLRIQVKDLCYPLVKGPMDVQFNGMLTKVSDSFPGGIVSGDGWVDILNQDLDGRLCLRNQEQGELLSAHIVSEKNNVSVTGEINSRDLIKKRKSQENQSSVEDMAVKALSFLGVDIGIIFSFETKLDDFRITNVSFSGRVGKPASEMKSQ